MAVAWLDRLPIPLIAGYSNQENNKVRSNDVETGPPRIELLSEHGFAMFNVAWSFSQIEMQLFEGWFKHEITFGANSFDMNIKVGAGLIEHEFYFVPGKPPKASLKGKRWAVKATLISIEKQYDTLSDYNTLKAANP